MDSHTKDIETPMSAAELEFVERKKKARGAYLLPCDDVEALAGKYHELVNKEVLKDVIKDMMYAFSKTG